MGLLKSVVLVDDNQFNNYINKNLIKDLGITNEIQIVHDGLEALKLVQEYSNSDTFPDLILLDIVMPTLNGIEFMNVYNTINFARNTSKPRVIVLTSTEDVKQIDEIKKLGVDDVIVKPLTQDKIISAIKKHFVLN
ncbi:MAG TPA: response regulator [Cytophagaceae bacterium]|jgi:CheY-like chemotaxis protein